MARTRDSDEDEPEERPRSRSRDEDEEDEPDDRPRRRRRRRRDDDDDYPESRSRDLGPLDKMYRDTNIVILVIFGCCCGVIAFILSLICYLTARDEKAKSNSLIVIIISAVMIVLGIIAQVTGQLNQLNRGR
jgi:hypothetical protein